MMGGDRESESDGYRNRFMDRKREREERERKREREKGVECWHTRSLSTPRQIDSEVYIQREIDRDR